MSTAHARDRNVLQYQRRRTEQHPFDHLADNRHGIAGAATDLELSYEVGDESVGGTAATTILRCVRTPRTTVGAGWGWLTHITLTTFTRHTRRTHHTRHTRHTHHTHHRSAFDNGVEEDDDDDENQGCDGNLIQHRGQYKSARRVVLFQGAQHVVVAVAVVIVHQHEHEQILRVVSFASGQRQCGYGSLLVAVLYLLAAKLKQAALPKSLRPRR